MEEEAQVDKLHIGETKPVIVPYVGLPIELFVLLIIGTFAIMNLFHATIFGLGTGVMVGGFASFLMHRDYNGIRIAGISVRLCSLWLGASAFGGITVAALPRKLRVIDQDIADALV